MIPAPNPPANNISNIITRLFLSYIQKRTSSASTGSTPVYSDVQRSWCGSLGTTNILNDTVTQKYIIFKENIKYMTKAELIFYEMTDREIFSRAKTVYEKLGMSEKGLLSVMRPTMGSVTILSVDLTNKIRDAVSMQYDDFLADDYIERAKKIQNEMKEKREESIREQKVSNSYIDKFNKEVQDSDNDFERECTKEIIRLIKLLPDKSAKKLIKKYFE